MHIHTRTHTHISSKYCVATKLSSLKTSSSTYAHVQQKCWAHQKTFPTHIHTHAHIHSLCFTLFFFFTTSSWSSPKPFGTFDSISTAMTIASKARSRFACMHMCMVVYLLHAPKSMPQLLINWKQLMANKVRTSRQIQTKIGQSAFMHAFMEVRRHNGIYQAHIYTHTCVSVRNLSFCVQKHNVLTHMYTY